MAHDFPLHCHVVPVSARQVEATLKERLTVMKEETPAHLFCAVALVSEKNPKDFMLIARIAWEAAAAPKVPRY